MRPTGSWFRRRDATRGTRVAAALAEDLEELVVEALGLALLVRGIRPLASEIGRSGADLVPGQAHDLSVSRGGSLSASLRLKQEIDALGLQCVALQVQRLGDVHL